MNARALPATRQSLATAVNERIRQTVSNDMREIGLWPTDEEYDEWNRKQARLGRAILGSTIEPLLGPEDVLWLHSNGPPQALQRILERALPKILAFGYEMGAGLCRISSGTSEHAHLAGIVASIFNLGITLFDYALDSTDTRQRVLEKLDSTTLRLLCADKAASISLGNDATLESSPAVRLLLKVTAQFFSQLHRLYPHETLKRATLSELVAKAHQAELGSVELNLELCERLEISAAKSKLPFFIFSQIAGVHAAPFGHVNLIQDYPDKLTESLGTVFWLIDDLADVTSDELSGTLNAILLRTHTSDKHELRSSETFFDALIASDIIKDASQEVCRHAVLIRSFFESSSCSEDPMKHFRESIFGYVRNWFPANGA